MAMTTVQSASPAQVRSRLSLLMAIVAGSVVVFVGNYVFFVRTTLGQELDNAALIGAEHEPQGVITEAWDLLDIISVASLALACVVIGVVALLRRRFALAFAALTTIAVANVATQLLKRVLLERPDLIGAGEANSLPSGHATVAATVAVGLVMVTAPRWRSVVALVSVVFPIAVAVDVVTASWHRPSDSIAAFCIVLGVAASSLAAVVAVFGFDAGERPPRWLRRSALALVSTAIVVLGGLSLLGLWAVRDRLRDGPLDARWETVAYTSSTAGIAAGALAVMLGLVLALRGIAVGHGGWNRTSDNGTAVPTDDEQVADLEV
jgi:membrane-associated phospholipid phosphatase